MGEFILTVGFLFIVLIFVLVYKVLQFILYAIPLYQEMVRNLREINTKLSGG